MILYESLDLESHSEVPLLKTVRGRKGLGKVRGQLERKQKIPK